MVRWGASHDASCIGRDGISVRDMRKQAASLAQLVEQSLGYNVFDASLYAFTKRECVS